jgi:hypothetical protein
MHILKQITVLTLALALTNCGSPAEEIDRTNVAPTAKLESAITVTRQEIQTATDAPSQTAADVGVVEPDVTISSAIVEKNEVRNDIVQRPSTSCQDLFLDAVEISAQNYLNNLEESWFSVRNNEKYSYVDPSGSVARNGPFATWFYEMAVEDVATTMPERFDSLEWADNMIMWQDYLDYTQATCDAYTGVGSIRSLQIALEKLLHQTGWSGHASHWEAFEYIDTGASIIDSPSPPGLEHYTKYITGGGVIIVGGTAVPDEALLAAREAVVFMTSARPEFQDILQRNEVRISLFGPEGDTSVLPEYQDENEPGGFAMGMTDASMTANAAWLCYPGNWDPGGNTVIHELTHTINHVVFEEINELIFYEQIYELALDAINNGVFIPGEQYLEEGKQADISNHMGEYWANAVEGYLMNRPGFKRSHDTRDWIRENDPNLYELITRYFPTEEWTYCPGVEDQKHLFGPEHPYSQR